MTQQVIIHANANGGVSVTIPTGEIHILDVQKKDTPAGSIIVDASTLPQGDDDKFFDAWVLVGDKVIVDMDRAKIHATKQLNIIAYSEAQHRSAKAGAGLTNVLADADWQAVISTARGSITAAKTTTELLAAIAPVQSAIEANTL